MGFVFRKQLLRTITLLALAGLLPLLGSCGTLGIATTDELAATESRLQNSNGATNTRIQKAESNSKEMQEDLMQLSANIDTLNVRFVRAQEWLEAMNLDTISAQAEEASKTATAIEEQNRMFLAKYLEWLKAQQAVIAERITAIEARIKDSAGAPAGSDAPSEPGKVDESSTEGTTE